MSGDEERQSIGEIQTRNILMSGRTRRYNPWRSVCRSAIDSRSIAHERTLLRAHERGVVRDGSRFDPAVRKSVQPQVHLPWTNDRRRHIRTIDAEEYSLGCGPSRAMAAKQARAILKVASVRVRTARTAR